MGLKKFAGRASFFQVGRSEIKISVQAYGHFQVTNRNRIGDRAAEAIGRGRYLTERGFPGVFSLVYAFETKREFARRVTAYLGKTSPTYPTDDGEPRCHG